jgi:hypothetical protein
VIIAKPDFKLIGCASFKKDPTQENVFLMRAAFGRVTGPHRQDTGHEKYTAFETAKKIAGMAAGNNCSV